MTANQMPISEEHPSRMVFAGPNLEERHQLEEERRLLEQRKAMPQTRKDNGQFGPKLDVTSDKAPKIKNEDDVYIKGSTLSKLLATTAIAAVVIFSPTGEQAPVPKQAEQQVVFQAKKPALPEEQHVQSVAPAKQTTISEPSKLKTVENSVENSIADATSNVALGGQVVAKSFSSLIPGFRLAPQPSQEQASASASMTEKTSDGTIFTPQLKEKADQAYKLANAWTQYKDGHELTMSQAQWNQVYIEYGDELTQKIPDWFKASQSEPEHAQPTPTNAPTPTTVEVAKVGPVLSQVPVTPESVPGVKNQEFLYDLNTKVLPITRAAGIPDAVVAAQAAVESAYGTSEAAQGNNWFGIMGWKMVNDREVRYLRSFDTIEDAANYYAATVQAIVKNNTGQDVGAFKNDPIRVLEALQGVITGPNTKKIERYEGDDENRAQYVYDVSNTEIFRDYGGGNVMKNNPWYTTVTH